MLISDIIKIFDVWAPKWVAWEKDNVGLQVGDSNRNVKRILVTLDVTKQVIQEAIAGKYELIVSHHPLLFRPPSTITRQDHIGELVLLLAEHKIALFSAHTNLDYTRDGVSFSLAKSLGLEKIRFLTPIKKTLAKIVVFIPDGYVEKVQKAMTDAGAGIIGEYSSCSFGIKGLGSFRGSNSSNPFLGRRGVLEHVEETRLEMICPRASVEHVINAMKFSHPYEEVAYDVYEVENPSPNFGMGAIGNLKKEQSLRAFLKIIKHKLGSEAIRYSGKLSKTIKRVALCGGGGSELLFDAITVGADAFITADVRYHMFNTAQDKIALIDAGHFETEQIIVRPVAERLLSAARHLQQSLNVSITKYLSNPIKTI
jgi:dinuclear metal center YbgI/SA1388 family protein